MFAGRSKRTSRDRESGLVFQWRLPLSNHLRFVTALVVVGFITAGLAAAVRVRVGGAVRHPERHASVVVIPRGDDWRALEMFAMEAGPLPQRDDFDTDPGVRSLIEQSLEAASSPAYPYRPVLQQVEVELPDAADAPSLRGTLPPLPQPEPPAISPASADPSRPVVLASGGLRAISPDAPPPGGLSRGSRYLLAYDGEGRVLRVTTLFSAKAVNGGAEIEAWLRQVKIEGGDKEGGWTAVEISSGS